jgi:hypothetical protein
MAMLTAVAGCGGAYSTYSGGGSSCLYLSDEAEVQLRYVEQEIDGLTDRLSLTDPLYTGDRTALVLNLPEPAYVYVVNLAPDGSRNIIWPSDTPRRVSGVQRIPEDGGWFTLSGETGQEVVAVVATRDRQMLTGTGEQRLISAVESAAKKRLTRLQSALPPGLTEAGHATMGVRGENLRLLGKTVSVSSYDPVVLILDVDHRAP